MVKIASAIFKPDFSDVSDTRTAGQRDIHHILLLRHPLRSISEHSRGCVGPIPPSPHYPLLFRDVLAHCLVSLITLFAAFSRSSSSSFCFSLCARLWAIFIIIFKSLSVVASTAFFMNASAATLNPKACKQRRP